MLSILSRRHIAVASRRSLGVVQNLSSTSTENELYAEEEIANEGEWAGCSRRFMAPIKISVRGDGELDQSVWICRLAIAPVLTRYIICVPLL